MMSDEIISYIKLVSVFVSVFYGLWQNFQKRKLENFISNKAIGLSKTLAIALGASQIARNSIVNLQVVSNEIGRCEGLLNAALIESADLYCSLKKPTIDEIEELAQNNETINSYSDIFKMFSNSKRGFIRKVAKGISQVY